MDPKENLRQTLTDHELYLAFLEGDNTSFDELMIRYGDSLTYYLAGKLGNLEEAEDMMIEAFARIMVKKPGIREGNFKAYLFKVARNLISKHYSRPGLKDVFSIEEIYEDISDGSRLEESIVDDERKRVLHLCMERIDPMMREALWLIYFEDLSYDDTAKIMKVNRKKIDNLLTRGRKQLKEELEKEGYKHAY